MDLAVDNHSTGTDPINDRGAARPFGGFTRGAPRLRRQRNDSAAGDAHRVTLGAIHNLGSDLFAVEGQLGAPLHILCRFGPRLYSISYDQAAAAVPREQRAACHALLLSYPDVTELVPISPSTAVARQSNIKVAADIQVGFTTWIGWMINDGELILLRAPESAGRVVIYIPAHRLVILDRAARRVRRERALTTRLLAMINSGDLRHLVDAEHALPIGASPARKLLVPRGLRRSDAAPNR